MTMRRLVIAAVLLALGAVTHTYAVRLYVDACDSRRAPEAACDGMTRKYGRTDIALGPIDMVALMSSADRPGLAEPAKAAQSAAFWAVGWGLWAWPLGVLLRYVSRYRRSSRLRVEPHMPDVVAPPPGRPD